MESKEDMYQVGIEQILEEAKKWENLEYAFKSIIEYIYSELEAGKTPERIYAECKKIYDGMEEENFDITKIIAWGAKVSLFYKKVESQINITNIKNFLISYFITYIFYYVEDNMEEALYELIQEGALGNIEVIDLAAMKKECGSYLGYAICSLEEYLEEYGEDSYYQHKKEQMSCLEHKLDEMRKVSDTIPVLRVNVLGEQEGKVFNSEDRCDTKEVVKKDIWQEKAAYIFVLESNLYIVDISDPL